MSTADGDGDGRAKRGNRKDERRSAAELRESSKILRKQVAEAEAEMKRLSQERGEIDDMLARPNANGSSVAELMKARADIERRLARAEQSWLEASEAVERAARAIAQ